MKPRSIKYFLTLFLFVSLTGAFAQDVLKNAMIGVNGLTCSACSRTVEMSIRKLPFVADVSMNLEHTSGTITFKSNAAVDPEKIAKAITDAGFSVRFLQLTVDFKPVTTSDNYCLQLNEKKYQLQGSANKELKGETVLKLRGESFMPKAEFKKIKDQLKPVCNGISNVFFVTL